MHASIDFFGARENLIHIEMLLGVVHHLKNHPPLARQTNAALTESLDEIAFAFRTVDALASRSAMRRRGRHCEIPSQLGVSKSNPETLAPGSQLKNSNSPGQN